MASSKKYLPIDGGIPVGGAFASFTSDAPYGTHFSHLGVGGYLELPDIEHRDSIPVGPEMNSDKLSSGRRKIGMIVYVISESKYYQLIPKYTDGTKVPYGAWMAAPDLQKLVWLDPSLQDVEDPLDPNIKYSGCGAACVGSIWDEVFTSANSTGDDLINEEFEVLGQNIGSYSVGQKVPKGEKLETVLKKILQKSVCPPYEQPVFSIASNITLSYEIGTTITPVITPSWNKKSAGEWKSYKLFKNNIEIPFAAKEYSLASQDLTSYTDPSIVLGSDTSYQAEIIWENGPVLKDNLNSDCPGQILTNASDPKKSNTLTFLAKRAVFYTVDNITVAPTQPSEIRNFTKTINVADGGELKFDVGTTAKRVVIAFPEAWGEISSVMDSGLGYDIKAEFIENRQTFSVEANSPGYAANYYVYTLTLKSTYENAVEYTVTI
jgi:hypothetical protein